MQLPVHGSWTREDIAADIQELASFCDLARPRANLEPELAM